jgi:hypothetical protein
VIILLERNGYNLNLDILFSEYFIFLLGDTQNFFSLYSSSILDKGEDLPLKSTLIMQKTSETFWHYIKPIFPFSQTYIAKKIFKNINLPVTYLLPTYKENIISHIYAEDNVLCIHIYAEDNVLCIHIYAEDNVL